MGGPRTDLVYNERVKAFTTAWNTAASFALATGIIAPSIAVFWGFGQRPAGVSFWPAVAGGVSWFVVATALHCVASIALGFLREPS